MTEPPPAVVPREYWEIWYAACRLLEENADLIALGDSSEEDGGVTTHNSGAECPSKGLGELPGGLSLAARPRPYSPECVER